MENREHIDTEYCEVCSTEAPVYRIILNRRSIVVENRSLKITL